MLKIKKVYFCFLAETLEPEEGALLLKDFEPLPFEFFDDLAVSGDLALPGDPLGLRDLFIVGLFGLVGDRRRLLNPGLLLDHVIRQNDEEGLDLAMPLGLDLPQDGLELLVGEHVW